MLLNALGFIIVFVFTAQAFLIRCALHLTSPQNIAIIQL